MNIVGSRIRKLRDEKGITQEIMAMEMEVTQSNYGRLEKDDQRLTVPKLLKIAEVLSVNISYLFNEKTAKVINQHNNENPNAYNVENLYNDNKDFTEKIIEQYELRIQEKDELITFLKKQH